MPAEDTEAARRKRNEEVARAAALFLVGQVYKTEAATGVGADAATGFLKVPGDTIQLYRSRFLALLGSKTKVPLDFLADVETSARRDRLLIRTLEEKVWERERLRLRDDASFQPETVRLIVNTITKVIERKEIGPLADFLIAHYEDALAIVSLSTQVDELKWRAATILMDDASKHKNGPRQSTDPIAKATKELLIDLARPEPVPLSAESHDSLVRLGGRVPSLISTLALLKDKELELAEAQVSYYRHYRAARVMKKLLYDLACGDGTAAVESYSILRETLDLSLNSHPYVRVLIASAYEAGSDHFHPYFCRRLQLPRNPMEVPDPVIAAQVLTPEILQNLFEESKRRGLEATLLDFDRRAFDEALGEVEAVMRESFTNLAGKAFSSAIVSEPLYENLIGPALSPVLERLKRRNGRTTTEPPKTDVPEKKEEKREKERGERGERSTEPRRSGDPLAVTPVPLLLARIQHYLGPDNVRIDWKDFPIKAPPEEKPRRDRTERNEDRTTPEESPIDPDPFFYPERRRERGNETDFRRVQAQEFTGAYAWTNKVFEILDLRAQILSTMDRDRQQAEYDLENRKTPIPEKTATREAIAAERLALIQAFLDVEHAMEASARAQAARELRSLTDEDAEEEALRAVVFFLKKHRSLGKFVVSNVGNDPTLRELWVKLFVRVVNGHLNIPKNLNKSAIPKPPGPDDGRTRMGRWLATLGYGAGIGALVVGTGTVMFFKGCDGAKSTTTPPPKTAPANPGGKKRPASEENDAIRNPETRPDGQLP